MPIIDLYDAVGPGLILNCRTGVVYTNQTGGTACWQPQMDGVYVPLTNEVRSDAENSVLLEEMLIAYCSGPKHRGTGMTSGLDAEDVDFVNQIIELARLTGTISVDLDRLRESHEAWVFVTVANPSVHFSGFEPYPRLGVLTWSNTD